MSAISVQSIPQVDETVRSGLSGTIRVEGGQTGQNPVSVVGAASVTSNPVVEKLAAAAAQASMPSNISLKFKVNEETNDVTIYVLDRASRQVLRTIPPEEMKNLQVGDLLELFV